MKKVKLIMTMLFALVLTISVSAQTPQKKAKKVTDEMTEVLSLNKKEAKAIYKIQLERFQEGKSIRDEYSDQPEVRKTKLNKLGSKVYNQLKDYLGIERLKKWKAHNKKK